MSELEYRGYHGSVHFDADDLVFYGKIEFIRALISYEATNAVELKQAFEEAIDDYLETCERDNIEPEKPFKGSFNIRVKPELHRKLAIAANNRDLKLNSFIAETLEKEMAIFEQSDKKIKCVIVTSKQGHSSSQVSHHNEHRKVQQTAIMARKTATKSSGHEKRK